MLDTVFHGKRALVTGANGFVGSHLCRELLRHGFKVTALHRSGSDVSSLQGLEVHCVTGDIRHKNEVLAAMVDVDVVFHIAALFRQAKHPDSVYYDINVTGTKNVIEAAIESGVQRVIHCSTVGVHSHIPNPPADEQEAYRPGDIYQESKCEGEKLALSYFRSGKIFGVVVRPAMIWGPEDKRTLKIFKGIAQKRFPLVGTGNTFLHWVLVTDLARGFRLAAERAKESGAIYILAGKSAVTMRRLYESISSFFGVTAPKLAIPALPVQIAGSLCELVCRPFGIEPPLYRRRVDFFTKTRSFNIDKARRELGYEPVNDFDGEVSLIGTWYRENGWIS